jgi:glycosyltransferase involved in cell wall biosynthesis
MNSDAHIRVSVIIPTYNYGEFIADALRSVEAQSLTGWECIVIDDASTDDTGEVVRSFLQRDPRFTYIRLDRNSGVSVARNRGFQEARGAFIQMIDADDVIGPRKLEAQVAFLEREPGVDVVYSDYASFRGAPDLSSPGAYRPDEQVSGAGDAIVSRLLRGNIFRLNTVLFRAGLLKEVGGFRDGFRYVEDWDFWLRIAAKGHRFHFLSAPGTLSGVRSNPRSLSTDGSAMQRHYLPVLQHLWVHGQLSFTNRVNVLLRYALFLLDRILLRKGEVIVLPEGRTAFLFLIALTSLAILPVWPFYKVFQGARRS